MIKLVLSPEMVAAIGQALGLASYNVAAPVLAEIQKQINEQNKGMPSVQEMREEVKAAT